MADLVLVDAHNVCAYLVKHKDNRDFHPIIDFLVNSYIHYALTVHPDVQEDHVRSFWSTAVHSKKNDVLTITATVDGKKIQVTEASIRKYLHLDDEEGITSLPNQTLFETF